MVSNCQVSCRERGKAGQRKMAKSFRSRFKNNSLVRRRGLIASQTSESIRKPMDKNFSKSTWTKVTSFIINTIIYFSYSHYFIIIIL